MGILIVLKRFFAMETVLKRLAEKYLSVFVKDYKTKKKDLDVAIFKGVIKLPDVTFNEEVLQSLLGIRYLEITKCYCGAMHLKIPWSKLKEQPVVVTLKSLHLELEEPKDLLTLKELPKILRGKDSKDAKDDDDEDDDGTSNKKKKKKKKKAKRHWFDAAWENITVTVEDLSVKIVSRGRKDWY